MRRPCMACQGRASGARRLCRRLPLTGHAMACDQGGCRAAGTRPANRLLWREPRRRGEGAAARQSLRRSCLFRCTLPPVPLHSVAAAGFATARSAPPRRTRYIFAAIPCCPVAVIVRALCARTGRLGAGHGRDGVAHSGATFYGASRVPDGAPHARSHALPTQARSHEKSSPVNGFHHSQESLYQAIRRAMPTRGDTPPRPPRQYRSGRMTRCL